MLSCPDIDIKKKYVKIFVSFLLVMITTWIVLFLTYQLVLATDPKKANETDQLVAVESNNDQKIYIRKINKHNRDGTYTIGYEADDGTFKYESKDVLGNVKGTIGYVDARGAIVKNVSYTTSKYASEPLTSAEDVKPSGISARIQKNPTTPYFVGRDTTTKVSVVYPHATSSTRSPTIQSIPRKKIILASSTTQASVASSKPYAYYTRQATDVSTSTSKSLLGTSPTTTPTYQPVSTSYSTSTSRGSTTTTTTPQPTKVIFTTSSPYSTSSRSHIQDTDRFTTTRPSDGSSTSTTPDSADSYYRKVLISREPKDDSQPSTERPSSTTTKTSLEDVNEKELSKKPMKSNTIRRQLNDRTGEYDATIRSPMAGLEDDSHDTYGSTTPSEVQRPLFTTGADPKPSVYRSPLVYRSQVRESASEDNGQASNVGNQEQANQPNRLNAEARLRRVMRLRQQRMYPTNGEEYYYGNVGPQQFTNGERPRPEPVYDGYDYRGDAHRPVAPPGYTYVPVESYQRDIGHGGGYQARSVVAPVNQIPVGPVNPIPVGPGNPIGQVAPIPLNPSVNPYAYDQTYYANDGPVAPPLTVRDFQRLLQQLIYVQQKLQQLTHSFQAYNNAYPQLGLPQIPQNPVPYELPDPRTRVYRPANRYQPTYQYQSAGQYPANYQQGYDPSGQQANQYVQEPSNRNQKSLAPDYLPADVREMLLLRMLQLAINSELAATDQMETVTRPGLEVRRGARPLRKYTPSNRSVKIVGQDVETSSARSKRDDDDEDMDMNE